MALQYNGTLEIPSDPGSVAEACLQSLAQLGFKVKKADPRTGVISAKKSTFNNAFSFSLQISRNGDFTDVNVHFEGEERGLVQAMMSTADSKVNDIISEFNTLVLEYLGFQNEVGW